jgi:hypothetical protein
MWYWLLFINSMFWFRLLTRFSENAIHGQDLVAFVIGPFGKQLVLDQTEKKPSRRSVFVWWLVMWFPVFTVFWCMIAFAMLLVTIPLSKQCMRVLLVLCNPWNKKLRGSSGCCGNLEATLAVA